MKLVSSDLASRAFLLQFMKIVEEFGSIIPRLSGFEEIVYSTSSSWFNDTLLFELGINEGEIVPYQFVSSDRAQTYIGDVLHFK